MRRWLRWLGIACVACIALAILGWLGIRKALRHQPSFYVQALSLPESEAEAAGIELEKEVLSLHNQVRHAGRWHVAFTEAELNGWLAVDLPSKLPKLLPKQVANPRIALRDDRLLVAFQHRDDGAEMVVSVVLRISTTAPANEIALRIEKARVGAVPLPLARLIRQVSDASRRSGVRLRWTERGGDPVALLQIAPRHPEFPDHVIQVDELSVGDGKMQLAGVVVHTSEVPQRPSMQAAPEKIVGKLVIPLQPDDLLRARVGQALMDGMPERVTR